MIYLDHAAATKPDPAVVEAMLPYLTEQFYNPSAFYQPAVRTREAVERSRRTIAAFLRVEPAGVYFTSGGTESDNWALRAAAQTRSGRGRHILASPIEHPAVHQTLLYLRQEGFEVEFLPVDELGRVPPKEARRRIRSDTILITVMHANNEIGTIQPVAELGEIARERGVLFHTDAVQTFGHIPIDAGGWNVNLLSASAHKLGGPRGVGLLYADPKIELCKLIFGGSQEQGRRPGTENTAAIVGFAKAVELAQTRMEREAKQVRELRDFFANQLKAQIPACSINGDPANGLPGILSVTFPNAEAESILIALDLNGICASAGSACSAGAREPSRVLTEIGLSDAAARRTIRFSLGAENTESEIIETVRVLRGIIPEGRQT